ncbi:hypothetical protein ScPMuIL_002285, partial [Solemya velum]
PDNLLPQFDKERFQSLHLEYDDVFDPDPQGYNGAAGSFEAVVNMGLVLPPQRKGHMPQYNHEKMVALQQKIDELEHKGVFRRPEDV